MIDDFIAKLNIEKGGVILITENGLSFFTKMRKIDKNFTFNLFLDKLIESIGKDGTLLIHTFNWDFCKGKPFDILNSKSKTSSIGNIALKRDDFSRTKHPIYSFAVTGKYKDYLVNLNNIGAFDKNSPFAFLYEKKAKMITFDVSIQDSFTFVHYVEEMEKVNYRYNKSFTAKYIDENGIETIKTYDMYVRDLEKNVVTYIETLEKLFSENSAMEIYKYENIDIRKIYLYKAYHIIENDIRNNNAKNLYKIDKN